MNTTQTRVFLMTLLLLFSLSASAGHLTIGNGVEVATLDPHKAQGVAESNVLRDLFEGLVITNRRGDIVPANAHHWQTNDHQHYRFTLRDDIFWSNGEPVTAQDYVYSWRRAVDPSTASPYAWFLSAAHIRGAQAIIDGTSPVSALGVKTEGPHSLLVELDRPVPYFVHMLAHTSFLPVHQKTIQRFGDHWTQPQHIVTNGAFLLIEWVINERLELGRNPSYWDHANTELERVTYLALDNPISEMYRFMTGEIDLTSTVPLEHYTRLRREQPESLLRKPNLCTEFYQFNTLRPPFNDVRVRQALAYAIDRNVLTDRLLAQGQIPAYHLIPPTTQDAPNWQPALANLTQSRRDSFARQLFVQAGYTKDHPLHLTLLYNTSDSIKKIALAISAMWQSTLPVKVELLNQEWKSYLSSTRLGEYQIARMGWCADYNEASAFLSYLASDALGGKYYHNRFYDSLLEKASLADTTAERVHFYQQAEEHLLGTMPLIPLYFGVTNRLATPRLQGYDPGYPAALYSKDLSLQLPPKTP
ncbi:peptide ABC transporter substrate-binding protein [Vibrio europaeus]|uniref:peptide ABC transporter substrate-binding protein n=1 Tax=Vibrio oreintalis group TaxID=1891919 RepID=UPI0018A722A9|nr:MULTISPECIES: peptide ABC transporter substrate-binding protein [Vibrio oreintalis group]MCG9579833.1 peptide ABC transporter substrate-binding protein [Vibrio tubiashii]MDC5808167.1 peptide ABC transporter substrate-binding protein [Vibrio europaeus]QPG38191.1 peptide ABC transporter substrate-binding protein [Vibrio europaeus]